jgi:hypothetical protein
MKRLSPALRPTGRDATLRLVYAVPELYAAVVVVL